MRLNNTAGVALASALVFVSGAEARNLRGAGIVAPTVTVTTSLALQNAIIAALGTCGGVIALRPGTYTNLNNVNPDVDNKVFTEACPLTITSTDPNNRAALADFNMAGNVWITFKQVDFTPANGGTSSYAFDHFNHVTFDSVSVHPAVMTRDPSNKGTGFKFFDSNYVTVINSSFRELNLTGVSFSTRDGLGNLGVGNRVLFSTFSFMGVDAIDGAQQSGLGVQGNVMCSFVTDDFGTPQVAHADAMQFSTTSTDVASSWSWIVDNLMYKGVGNEFQGAFGGDDSQGFNRKMTDAYIALNTIIGAGANSIDQTDQVRIRFDRNNIIGFVGDSTARLVAQTINGITSTGNVAPSIQLTGGGNTNVTQVGDTTNSAVSDGGAAALAIWKAAHAGRAGCPV